MEVRDESRLAPYRGIVAPAYRGERVLDELRELPTRLGRPPEAPASPFRRARVERADLPVDGHVVSVAVKSFGPQGRIRSRLAQRYGSKARRSFDMALALHERGIGTPRPIAFLERWDRGRLVESYFVTEFEERTSTLHDELLHLFEQEFQLGKFLELMDCVARAARAMHDAGVFHGDLGNQNVFLRRLGPERWGDVCFIDVNRGRVRDGALSLRARARDLSRLTLPARLRAIFGTMYFRERWAEGRFPPRAFLRHERLYRLRFALHTATRPLRHPVKWLRRRRLDRRTYPKPKERWIWDERSDQAIGTLGKLERLVQQSPWRALRLLWTSLVALPPAYRRYRELLATCYRNPVEVRGRVGMTIHPAPDTADAEIALLDELGPDLPVLVRFYRHEDEARWDFGAALVRRLVDAGHPVALALVQDRAAVKDPRLWRAFLDYVLARTGHLAEWAEIGHATNRTKWGLWTLGEYARLVRPFRELKERFPGLRLMGPAINDFEYQYIAGQLSRFPKGLALDALSLHLYVDRRGSPENRQHRFTAVDKFVLARALSQHDRRARGGVIVSEVNWFLRDPGGYAHPFAPYVSPEWPDWDITEDVYADYMLRYYLHAICSGMVDRVYWWRLVSAPFGLVDDSGAAWRKRPAFEALRILVRELGDATFTDRLDAGDDQCYLFRFRRRDDEVVVGFRAESEPARVALPFRWERAMTSTGAPAEEPERLAGRPVYFFGVTT